MIFLILLFESVFSYKPNGKDIYDYIVVGAGPAGATTAMELAKKGKKTLLIEAGGYYDSPNVTVPAFHFRALEDPNISWHYYVKHYKESTGKRQKVMYPRASGLGGCALHNALINIYPNKSDFEDIFKMTGDNSWLENNMHKYYNKIADDSKVGNAFSYLNVFKSNKKENSSIVKDTWLPLNNFDLPKILALDPKLIDLTAQILGKAITGDTKGVNINGYDKDGNLYNGKEGSFILPMNIVTSPQAKRHTVADELKRVWGGLSLDIWTNTFATKIIFAKGKDKPKAVGVEYKRGAYLYKASPNHKPEFISDAKFGTVFARKEIIISAGTYNTPQLLMLSGIGDEKELTPHGIKTIKHLRGVGKNLQDRYEISVNFKFDKKFELTKKCKFEIGDPCYIKYIKSNLGTYTFNGVFTGHLMKSDKEKPESDLFIVSLPVLFKGYHNGVAQELADAKDIFTFLILKAHTNNNSGTVKLLSNNPFDVPDINFRYFEKNAEQDINALIKGIDYARKVFKKFKSKNKEVWPGNNVNSIIDMKEYIKDNAWGHHACCTAAIGKDGDPMAVLDGQFRVRGVQGLRVVDMSIFKKIPGYFPTLLLYMIGSKAADVIAADQ